MRENFSLDDTLALRLRRICEKEVVGAREDVVDTVPARFDDECRGDAVACRHAGENKRLLDVVGVALPGDDARRLLSRVVECPAHLTRIETSEAKVNAFTDVLAERARKRAAEIDSGRHRGPLVGVPFAVKNLFDIKGLATRAGSKINLDGPKAARDGALVRKLGLKVD